MQSSSEEYNNFSLSRFESMLKTNNVLFFDSVEFEEIIQYYLENGKVALARKAVKLGLEQHPSSTNLKLFQVEMFIFENELDNFIKSSWRYSIKAMLKHYVPLWVFNIFGGFRN